MGVDWRKFESERLLVKIASYDAAIRVALAAAEVLMMLLILVVLMATAKIVGWFKRR